MTSTARPSGPALTSDRLGEAWPEVSARLRKMLGSRGVDPSLSDDIVQEVAVRALDKQVPFTDPADLYRWAATTARHLHIDHLRCDGRTTYDDALVGLADGTDVAHTAERRVALGHVLRAMAGLRPGERAAILESLEDREARSSQALVRRHRARATLRKAVGGAIVAATTARLRLRAFAPAMRDAAAAATLAPALVAGAGSLIADDRAPAAPERVVTAQAPAQRTAVRPAAPVAVGRTPATRVAVPVAARPRPRAVVVAAPESPATPPEPGKLPVKYRERNPGPNEKVACLRHGTYAFCVDDPPTRPIP